MEVGRNCDRMVDEQSRQGSDQQPDRGRRFIFLIVVCGIGVFIFLLSIAYLIWSILSKYYSMKSQG